MAKIRLTKNELKKQKDALKRFQRYLPTLVLKKQLLQVEIRKVEAQMEERQAELNGIKDELTGWIGVFGEEAGLGGIIGISGVRTDRGNVAGVDIPLYTGIDITVNSYDLFETPLWVDRAVEVIEKMAELDARVIVLKEQVALLGEELRITSQRVNLFEKVKIPETKEHIRIIQIYLGDEDTAAVVRGKMAKKKLVRVS